MQLTPRTSVAVKIAALAKISTEALNDFSLFASFVPQELSRAMTDALTDWVVSASNTGLIWQTAKTYNRFLGTDAPGLPGKGRRRPKGRDPLMPQRI